MGVFRFGECLGEPLPVYRIHLLFCQFLYLLHRGLLLLCRMAAYAACRVHMAGMASAL